MYNRYTVRMGLDFNTTGGESVVFIQGYFNIQTVHLVTPVGAWPGWHMDSYLYGGVCVVLVGCVQGELDLEDLGSTQQQFLPLLSVPGAE